MTHKGLSINHLRTSYQGNYANFFIVCHYYFCYNYHYLYSLWYSATDIYITISVYPAYPHMTSSRLDGYEYLQPFTVHVSYRRCAAAELSKTTWLVHTALYALIALCTYGFDLPPGVELCPSSMCCYYRREYKKFIRVVYDIACFCPSLWQN